MIEEVVEKADGVGVARNDLAVAFDKSILRETTGRKRNRIFRFDALLARFREPLTATTAAAETTLS